MAAEVVVNVRGKADPAQIEHLKGILEKLGPDLDAIFAKFQGDKVFDRVREAADRAAPRVKEVGDAAATAGQKAQTSGGMFDGWLGKLAKIGLAAGGATAILGIGQAALGMGQDLLAGNAQMETYNTQLATLMGSAEGAQERMAELSEFGAKTPFEVPQLVEAEKVMIGFGLTTGKSMELAKMSAGDMRTVIGDVAAGTGKDFAEIALTFGKFSAGATGEAISRLQELGVVTREELAAQGVEFSKSGQLLSPLPVAFEAATKIAGEKFGGGMDALSNTFEGKMSTLSDTWSSIKRAFMAPVFDIAKAGLDAILPLLSDFAGKASEVSAAFESGGLTAAAGKLQELTGIDLSGFVGAVLNLADAFSAFTGGDKSEGFLFITQAIRDLTGVDVTGWASTFEGAWDSVASGAQTLLDVGLKVSAWLLEHKELVAGVVVALGAFSVIATVVGWVSGLVAAFASASAGITAAGGVLAFIVGVLGGPVTIAIGAVAVIVGLFAAAWATNFGGIRDKVATFVDWLKSNLGPPITAIFGSIRSVLLSLVSFWRENGDQIMEVVGGIVGFVTQQFGFLFDILTGIVKAGIALITGDWAGLGAALGQILAGAVNLVTGGLRGLVDTAKNVLGGLKTLVTNLVKGAIDTLVSLFKGGSKDSSKGLIDGLVSGIKSGAGAVVSAIKDLAGSLVSSFMANLKMASPSKVFEELGAWITLGLASGIHKEDQKAIAALASIITQMNTVIQGVSDFASKLLNFIVPSPQQIDAAEAKFMEIVVIVQRFVKTFAYLGSLLPTANRSGASGDQISLIDAVLSKWGIDSRDLITGSEADWTGRLVEIIGKVTSAWGQIAESMTKMADAKFPTEAQIAELQKQAVALILWAGEITKGQLINPVGVQDFANTVKSAADMLTTVAKVDLGNLVAISLDKLTTARDNAQLLARVAVPLAAAFAIAAGTGDQRADLVKSVSDYATVVKSAADILGAGATDKLAEVTAVEARQLDIAAANGTRMIGAVGGLVFAFRDQGGTEAQRAELLAAVKQYADLVKGAGDILGAGGALDLADATDVDLVQLDIAATNAAEMARQVVLLSVDFRLMSEEAQAQLASGAKGYADVVSAAAAVLGAGAALKLADATDVDLMQLDVATTNAAEMFRAVELLSETFRKMDADSQAALSDGAKRYAEMIKSAADVLSVASGVDLSKAFKFEWNAVEEAGRIAAALYAKIVELSADLAAMAAGAQTNLAGAAKAYGEAVKGAADALGVSAGLNLSKAFDFEWNAIDMAGQIAAALFTKIRELSADMAAMTSDDQKGIAEGAKNYASVVAAAASMFSNVADAVSKLANVSNTGDLSSKLATVRGWVRLLWSELEQVAKDITADEAKARSEVATAVGTASEGLAKVAESVGKLMEMATGGLFAPNAGRSDIGFMQRVRARRADFNASVLTDSIKRMVGSLMAALSTIDLPAVDDPKILALDALAGAFDRLADALDKLGTVKLPDAAMLAAIINAAREAANAGSPGVPGSGGGGGAGGSGTGGDTGGGGNRGNGGVPVVVNFRPSMQPVFQIDGHEFARGITMIAPELVLKAITEPQGG